MAILSKKEERPNMPLLNREDDNVVSRSGELNALLGKGSEFEGKLTFEGQVRIDGKFTGQIFTKDTLVIGDGAKVAAEISAGTATWSTGASGRDASRACSRHGLGYSLHRRAGCGLAATRWRRHLPHFQSAQRLFLPPHGDARSAPTRWGWGPGLYSPGRATNNQSVPRPRLR